MYRLISALIVLVILVGAGVSASAHNWNPMVQIRGQNYANDYFGGSFAQRADGQWLTSYVVGNRVMLSVVSSEASLTGIDNASASQEWAFHEFYSSSSKSRSLLQKLSSGRILLYLLEAGVPTEVSKPFRLTVYESSNGLGTDFVLKATLDTVPLPFYNFCENDIGQAIEVNGKIIFPVAAPILGMFGSNPVATCRLYAAISSDGGANWAFSQVAEDSWRRGTSRSFGIAGNEVIILVKDNYAGGSTYLASHSIATLLADAGPIQTTCMEPICNHPTWTNSNTYVVPQGISDLYYSHIFHQPDGYTYLLRDTNGIKWEYRIYRRLSSLPINLSGQGPYQTGAIGSGATWEGPIDDGSVGDDGTELLSVMPSGDVAIYGTSWHGAGSISYIRVAKPFNMSRNGFE